MNEFLNHISSQHTAQGHPEGIIIFQPTKPEHKACNRRKCFSTATTARKNVYINQIKNTHTN